MLRLFLRSITECQNTNRGAVSAAKFRDSAVMVIVGNRRMWSWGSLQYQSSGIKLRKNRWGRQKFEI